MIIKKRSCAMTDNQTTFQKRQNDTDKYSEINRTLILWKMWTTLLQAKIIKHAWVSSWHHIRWKWGVDFFKNNCTIFLGAELFALVNRL